MKPIRVRAGALGPGVPSRELLVPPRHRIALPQTEPTCIVAAKKLLSLPGISERPSCRLARYYHLLLGHHELVRANGAWAETLLVTGYSSSLAGLPTPLRRRKMKPVRKIKTRPPFS